MRRVYIILLLGVLILGGVSTTPSFADSIFDEIPDQESVEGNYEFPLDNQSQDIYENTFGSEANNNGDEKAKSDIKDATVEYTEETASARMKLSSETVDFYPETSQYVAKGNARVIVPEEKLQMDANEIIIDQQNHELIGVGNVKIVKSGHEYFGDYIRINTKKEDSFFTNPILFYTEITVDAKKATMHANETIANDGVAVIDKKTRMLISTTRFGQMSAKRLFNHDKAMDEGPKDYKIVAKKLIVKREKDTNKVTIKNATIYRGDHKIAYSPNFSLALDKDINYVETTFPEIGNKRKIGSYFSPAWVFALPNAQIGMMDAEKAVAIMYADEISAADNKNAVISEKTAEYAALQGSADAAAKRGYVDNIINPEETRKHLVYAFDMLFTKNENGPAKKHGTV